MKITEGKKARSCVQIGTRRKTVQIGRRCEDIPKRTRREAMYR